MDSDRQELLALVASLYFEQNFKQEQIAAQTGYSRSMVSRLISEARQQGVVEIRINYPLERCLDLERNLAHSLGLSNALVLRRGALAYDAMLRRLGILAARFIEDQIQDGMRVGVSWGTALWETASALKNAALRGVQVIQIVGSLGTPDPEMDGPDLARQVARALGGTYSTLAAPLLVDSPATRQALVNDQRLRRALGQVAQVDMALVGIGTIHPEKSSLLRAGYLSLAEVRALKRRGVAGDVCAIQYDRHGKIFTDLLENRIGINPDDLRRVPVIVGVAGGEEKAEAILGACRAGLVNNLVTDESAARQIVKMIEEAE